MAADIRQPNPLQRMSLGRQSIKLEDGRTIEVFNTTVVTPSGLSRLSKPMKQQIMNADDGEAQRARTGDVPPKAGSLGRNSASASEVSLPAGLARTSLAKAALELKRLSLEAPTVKPILRITGPGGREVWYKSEGGRFKSQGFLSDCTIKLQAGVDYTIAMDLPDTFPMKNNLIRCPTPLCSTLCAVVQ